MDNERRIEMETNEKQISRNIKACRNRTGKSQKKIAEELNITKATYSNIENNPLRYSIKKLNAIAKNLHCNIDEFFLKR